MTKRRSWIVPTLAALAALAVAPPSALQGQQVGILGGANFASISGDDVGDRDRRTGLRAGLFGEFPLGMVLTFRPEATYTQKGAGDLELDYIEIPFLLRIGVPFAPLGLYALAGPTMAFEVGCSVSDSDVTPVVSCDDDGDDDARKSFLVGGHVGLGVDLGLVDVDGRYGFDLESFTDESVADWSHRVWMLTASVGFPFGG